MFEAALLMMVGPPLALVAGLALVASGANRSRGAVARTRAGLWLLVAAIGSLGAGACVYWLCGLGFSELGGPPDDLGKWPGVTLWAGCCRRLRWVRLYSRDLPPGGASWSNQRQVMRGPPEEIFPVNRDNAGLPVELEAVAEDRCEPSLDELPADDWAEQLRDRWVCRVAELWAERADGLELTLEFAVDAGDLPA
jgi:hypothetical protein